MEKNQLVSIIMNCYNSDEFLHEAIESVLNQTYENFELIFWDNQSTDNSSHIIKSYQDNRIKYYYAAEFTTLGVARNLAIEKAIGSWIGFLDCDDRYDKNKLLFSMSDNSLKLNDSISLIYSKSQSITHDNNNILRSSICQSGNIYEALLLEGDFIVFSSIIVHKNILIKVGKINPLLNYCEDYDLLLKILENNTALCIDKVLTYRREHVNNITQKKYKENTIEYVMYMLEYLNTHKLSLKINMTVRKKLIYEINIVLIKLFKDYRYKEILKFISKFKFFIVFLPFVIIRFLLRNHSI